MIKATDLDVETETMLGTGSFGTVFRATWRGTAVAAKQLHRKRLGATETLDVQMEGGLAIRLRHPHISQVLGVCHDGSTGKVFVVSEFMARGSVYDAIVSARRAVSERIKIKVAREAALGLRYLHEQSPAVVHRSVTSRNVLLGKDWVAKVSDFGLARIKDGAATMTKLATSGYSAPEVLRGERYDERADVFAFGVVVWEMAAQEEAFSGLALQTMVERVTGGARPEVDDKWRRGDSLPLVRVMEACWRGEAGERPRMDAVGEMLE